MTEEKRAEESGIQVVGYLQRIFPRGQAQGRHTTAASGEAKPSEVRPQLFYFLQDYLGMCFMPLGTFLRILFQNSSPIFTFRRPSVDKRHMSIYANIYIDFEH